MFGVPKDDTPPKLRYERKKEERKENVSIKIVPCTYLLSHLSVLVYYALDYQ